MMRHLKRQQSVCAGGGVAGRAELMIELGETEEAREDAMEQEGAEEREGQHEGGEQEHAKSQSRSDSNVQ